MESNSGGEYEINADTSLRDLPLILLTSVYARAHAKQMEAIGFSGYLTKPIKQSQLFDCIATVMGTKSTIEETELEEHMIGTISNATRSRARILVVEDNIVNQKVTVRNLEKAGYSCDVAANGQEAIEALSLISYDLILMDCQMPVMDGFEATAAIRASEMESGDHIPIVAITANAMRGDRQRCLDAGMDDYISKPIRSNKLSAILAKWLGGDPESARVQSAVESPTYLSIVDFSGILELAADDEEFIAEVVDEFLNSIPKRITNLKAALEESETPMAQREAHSIKGSAATFRAELLGEIAARIEQLAVEADLTAATELLADLDQQWFRVEGEVQRWQTDILG